MSVSECSQFGYKESIEKKNYLQFIQLNIQQHSAKEPNICYIPNFTNENCLKIYWKNNHFIPKFFTNLPYITSFILTIQLYLIIYF